MSSDVLQHFSPQDQSVPFVRVLKKPLFLEHEGREGGGNGISVLNVWTGCYIYLWRICTLTVLFPCADYPGEESYQPRDYLAATMQFMPGHFACEAVWSTIIHVHSRLKMGPNMGVARGE